MLRELCEGEVRINGLKASKWQNISYGEALPKDEA